MTGNAQMALCLLLIGCSAGTGIPPDTDTDGGQDLGRALLIGVPTLAPCTKDMIQKIYAIPANLALGQSTSIELETFDEAIEGKPRFSFTINEVASAAAQAELAPHFPCADGAATCQQVTCLGVTHQQLPDPNLGYRSAEVRVSVTVADQTCTDSEEISVDCMEARRCNGEIVPCVATGTQVCLPCPEDGLVATP